MTHCFLRNITCAVALVFLMTVFVVPSFVEAEQAYYGKPYLTWQGDPSTTVTVTYHTAEKPEAVVVAYDVASQPEAYHFSAYGDSWQIPGLPDGRFINSVEITGLNPGTDYWFRIWDGAAYSEEYQFRTLPTEDVPVRFAVCGDTLATSIFRELIVRMGAENPLFFLIGGDLAYANGDFDSIDRWNNWFQLWHEHGRAADGRLVPLILGIGNHETNKLEGDHETRAPFFFGFFPQGGKVCWSHQIGANLGLIILDSNHLVPHVEQVDWLEDQLTSFAALPFRVAVYHVPLYPSHRDYDGSSSAAGREHWLPLFDEHRLSVGFENHDHTFKRTKRLRNNEEHPEGTLYVGDGNAGVVPRVPKTGLGYMDKVSRDSHFWLVDVSHTELRLRAINRAGDVFDEATISAASGAE